MMMKAFDQDNDRKISQKEWQAGFKQYKDPVKKVEHTVINTDFDRWAAPVAARKLLLAFQAKNQNIDRAFFLFDKDRNGELSMTELKEGINMILPKDTFNLGEVNMALKYFDRDCKGTIDRKEWNAGFAHVAAKYKEEQEKLIARRNAKYETR